ncbi:thioredoxin domain-containing protein [Aetokthonos hydrillicola Thurmond2011]|jgi:protein-disulfide isomerase|uniref:Thioredoxin domain-containing protein n=2 Tax=Aetokthonos TaxID=1550243 RepID=A0AAP5I5I9_9CYAN|nr:thioredoxin domain-containing protein [Aetokthonos hydrillicola]MBO3461832.1 thioredoxin domain-containing protein [Aetokthonos hydrillicola CCALA 1050]MDR9894087.1 thioredoxin domain-containing protein [Aetokthonos hydrillicola Thurmond2011]
MGSIIMITGLNLYIFNQYLEYLIAINIQKHPDLILNSVKDYQLKLERAKNQAIENISNDLMKNPVDFIGDSPTLGSQDKKIILVEFSDFQCPFCARAHNNISKFMQKNGNEVTFVYKHLPLVNIHKEAMPAALASWAAGKQGKFWEFHKALFENQDKLEDALYVKIAQQLNLDLKKFDKDRKSNAAKDAIKKDITLAEKLNISSTPYFLFNGRPMSGVISSQILENTLRQVKNN